MSTAVHHVVRVDDGRWFASDLFHSTFGQTPPDEPAHYAAFQREHPSLFRVIGYFHVRFRPEYALVGGLCVAPAFRGTGVGQALELAPERDAGNVKAFFAYAGNPARAERIGYRATGHDHLLVKWLQPVTAAEAERLIAEVAALGPF